MQVTVMPSPPPIRGRSMLAYLGIKWAEETQPPVDVSTERQGNEPPPWVLQTGDPRKKEHRIMGGQRHGGCWVSI